LTVFDDILESFHSSSSSDEVISCELSSIFNRLFINIFLNGSLIVKEVKIIVCLDQAWQEACESFSIVYDVITDSLAKVRVVVVNDKVTTHFLVSHNSVDGDRLLFQQNKVLVNLSESIINENINVDVSVYIEMQTVLVKWLTGFDPVLVEYAVSYVAKSIIDDDWRPYFVWVVKIFISRWPLVMLYTEFFRACGRVDIQTTQSKFGSSVDAFKNAQTIFISSLFDISWMTHL